MKKIILVIIIVFLHSYSFSQIRATTSSGKKVILNMDGTWKYAEEKDANNQDDKGCEESRTGNITVINKATHDIYFYYSLDRKIYRNRSFVKVKAGGSKTIKYIPAEANAGIYYWKAVLETVDSNTDMSEVDGVANGTFSVVQCVTKEVEIEN